MSTCRRRWKPPARSGRGAGGRSSWPWTLRQCTRRVTLSMCRPMEYGWWTPCRPSTCAFCDGEPLLMIPPIRHPHETESNKTRNDLSDVEPRAVRTYTPTLAVLARSAGVYHWTPEGRRLYDFTSGVLVANLGHNPEPWMRRFTEYMGWR